MQHVSWFLLLCATICASAHSPNANAQQPSQEEHVMRRRSNSGGIVIPFTVHQSSHLKRAAPSRFGMLSAKEIANLDFTTDTDALQDARDALLFKYGSEAKIKRLKQAQKARASNEERQVGDARMERRDPKVLPLTNHVFDTSYSTTINLGTPSKPFDVMLDTGSSDTWVASSSCSCTGTGCTSCSTGNSWDPSSSSSWSPREKTLSITYGSGLVIGRTGQDVVSLGGYTVNDQVIGIVDQAARRLPGDIEGIMGLAFGTIAKSGGTPWWLRVFAGEGGSNPDAKMISFWLSRYVDSTDTANSRHPGGQFIIGGTNSTLYEGDINYVDAVHPAKWWAIPIQGIGLDGGDSVTIPEGAQVSIIDTGTTLVGGEETALKTIFGGIPGSRDAGDLSIRLRGFWAIPCNTTASVTLTFGSNSYPYSARDLLYQRIDDLLENYCVSSLFTYSSTDRNSSVFTAPGQPFWLVGAAFLKNVYSVFNLGDGGSGEAGVQGMGNDGATAQIGFAKLSGVSGEIGLGTETPNNVTANSTTNSTATSTSRGPRPAGTDLPIPQGPPVDVTTTVVVVNATDEPTANGSFGWRTAETPASVFLSLLSALLLGLSLA
ncbi:acid protease [Serendipita vermifera]|nr:acid protease [Serendipita vermifera]